MKYVLAIDQSTQGTKAVVLDSRGMMVSSAYRAHRQIVNQKGHISHDLNEIWQNLLEAAREAVGERRKEVAAIGIANQRETSCLWNEDGPLAQAVVWQCARGREIVNGLEQHGELIRERTGLLLSPYFPAAKYAWLLRNAPLSGAAHLGTMDSFLLWKMTGRLLTDSSNAARTQLLDIEKNTWDEELCGLFGIPVRYLPEVVDSDAEFGYTDLEGVLERPVPIRAVMGDSNAALYAHCGDRAGQCKVTYGTGSSIMLNTGRMRKHSRYGLSTSIAWSVGGERSYVLEGNINYSCAVISWLKELGIISDAREIGALAAQANPADTAVLVPAFSGLSAPYWRPEAKAAILGMTRTTGRSELCRAAEESIALQIADVLACMRSDAGLQIDTLHADGGATKDGYLMQLQADLADARLMVSDVAELSALGVGRMAGVAAGVFEQDKVRSVQYQSYEPKASREAAQEKRKRWKHIILALE